MSGEHSVSEDDGDVSVCVDSGVTEGFQRNLSVNLTATDGTASKCTPLFRTNTCDSHCHLFKKAVEEDTELDDSLIVLVFPVAGLERVLCTSISINDDSLLEGNQELTITVTDAGAHAVIDTDRSTTRVLITDNDCKMLSLTIILLCNFSS